jgi:hypothetical protein
MEEGSAVHHGCTVVQGAVEAPPASRAKHRFEPPRLERDGIHFDHDAGPPNQAARIRTGTTRIPFLQVKWR